MVFALPQTMSDERHGRFPSPRPFPLGEGYFESAPGATFTLRLDWGAYLTKWTELAIAHA